MCLIHFHFQDHPTYQLIVAANRDEFYKRPTEQAHYWPDVPNLLAGRDLLQKGTWLGMTKEGRFAALTNIRDLSLEGKDKRSRGEIVHNFLASNIDPVEYLENVKEERKAYAGFNVVVGNPGELYHYNNVENSITKITPGTHSLSNATLNTPWPKVVKGKNRLNEYIRNNEQINPERLFSILEDEELAPDHELPDTGIGMELERKLSASFIKTPDYGTRSATVVLIDRNQEVQFIERTYENGDFKTENKFTFTLPITTK